MTLPPFITGEQPRAINAFSHSLGRVRPTIPEIRRPRTGHWRPGLRPPAPGAFSWRRTRRPRSPKGPAARPAAGPHPSGLRVRSSTRAAGTLQPARSEALECRGACRVLASRCQVEFDPVKRSVGGLGHLHSHVAATLLAVVPELALLVAQRLRAQLRRLQSISPRAIASSSLSSAFVRRRPGPDASPSSMRSRSRLLACSS